MSMRGLILALLVVMFGTTEARAGMSATAVRTQLRILVPSEARVYISDQPLRSKGEEREFRSPLLPAGKRYSYEVRVEHEGKTVTRRVGFTAGGMVEVDFRPDFRKQAEPDIEEDGRRFDGPFKPLRRSEPKIMRA